MRWDLRVVTLQAFWIGLAGGACEVAIQAWRRLVEGRLVFVGSDYWWLAPIITGTVVACAGALAWLVIPGRWKGHPVFGRVVPLWLAMLGILLLFPAISKPAAVLLALGLAIRCGVWLSRRAPGFERVVARTMLPGLALLFAGGAILHLAPRVLTLGRDPASAPAAPNILLIVLDTVRAIELGIYGRQPSLTPNLDGLASQGVVFEQAFSTSPWTGPSHASLFTGHPASALSIDWERPLDRRFPTLAEILRQAGYLTLGVTGNTLYVSRETGLPRGFDRYEDSHLTPGRALLQSRLAREFLRQYHWLKSRRVPEELSRVPAGRVTRNLLRMTRHQRPGPYFAFLNYYDAHSPYLAPEPHWNKLLPGHPRVPLAVRPGAAPQDVEHGRNGYRATIAHLDAEVGRLLDTLLRRGGMDNTLVVITADHGEEFLEHGVAGHGASLYTQAVRVPLILVWLGRLPAGVRIQEPVSLERIPATIMQLAGLDGPFPGPSLPGFSADGPHPRPAVRTSVRLPPDLAGKTSNGGFIASVQAGSFRYIRSADDPAGQLYDHASDPLEVRNLAADPEWHSILQALRDSLSDSSGVPVSRASVPDRRRGVPPPQHRPHAGGARR